MPKKGAGPRLVAPVLQDMLQHGARQTAQLAGREASWELQQIASVQGDHAEDEPDQEGNGQDVMCLT